MYTNVYIEVLFDVEFSPRYYGHLIFMRGENRYPNFMRVCRNEINSRAHEERL